MGLFSSSKSNSQTFTENADLRVVGGDNSLNTSQKIDVSGSSNTITATDFGAVSGSLKLALQGVEGAQRTASQAIESTGGLLSGALDMVGRQQKEFTSAVENIKTGDNRALIVVGMAVVGIAAFAYFNR